ncbi:MAG: hypothetical protein GVY10_06640 [Verrucomicrobia bacterium]|jgi:hypothetical protein|nr:hypothetical protein [Verrucomicrobiota bacterium]
MKKSTILALALGGMVSGLSAQTSVPAGSLGGDATWTPAGSPYILEGAVFVDGGATLTILPGTVVRGQPRTGPIQDTANDPGSLVVAQDGTINAAGTREDPIIFTTAAIDNNNDGIADGDGSYLTAYSGASDTFLDATPESSVLPQTAPGNLPRLQIGSSSLNGNVALWGGVIILGNAPTNVNDVAPGLAEVEGLPAAFNAQYGGNFPNDNSGTLEFVSIRYGGDVIGAGNEINGLTLGGVGRGTTISHVEVYQNWDDGVEWFGGTVDADHLAVTFVGDDSLDGDQGFTGTTQFAVVVQATENIGSGGGDKPFEFDGEDGTTASDSNLDSNLDVTPFPSYQVANFTVVGNGGAYIRLRNGFSGALYNGLVDNCTEAWQDQTPNPVVVQGVTWASDTGAGVMGSDGNEVASDNQVAAGGEVILGDDLTGSETLDLRPQSPFANGAEVTLPAALYESIGTRGAIRFGAGAGATWPAGWTALDLNDFNKG